MTGVKWRSHNLCHNTALGFNYEANINSFDINDLKLIPKDVFGTCFYEFQMIFQ